MLIRIFKILAFNGDNATSNDKQTDCLNALPNSFNQVNRVRCFNHTMQLSAKRLLKPFTSSTGPADTEDDGDVSHTISDADVAFTSRDTIDIDSLSEDTDDDLVDDHCDLGDPGNDGDNSEDGKDDEDNLELIESAATIHIALSKVHLHYNPLLLFLMANV